MFAGKKILGLIPARSGSKGVPDKNISLLGGKPLLGWVAEQARQCHFLDRLIISTDSKHYADIAATFQVEAPFLRPPALAGDETSSLEVILHALEWFRENKGEDFDYLCLIQPTACFTLAEDYQRAVQKAQETDADTVITVTRCGQIHPALMYTLGENGRAEWFLKDPSQARMVRRQDLPPIYRRTGNVYLFKCETLIQTQSLYGGSIYTIEVPEERAFDIDTPFDWKIAEALKM